MHKTERVEIAAKQGKADQARATVYCDGSSPLCSVEIGHYASCEGSDGLHFVDVSNSNVRLGDDLTRQAAMGWFHVRRADGKLVSGARGFSELRGALPNWHWLARIARLPGILPLLELAYRGFLPLRPMLSRIASWVGAKPVNQKDTLS